MTAIFLTLKTYWRLWVFLALMCVAFVGGWYVEWLRKDQDIATIQKAEDDYKKAVNDAATAQLAQALAKQQSAEQAAADTPVAGVAVNFGVNAGTVTPASAQTNANGQITANITNTAAGPITFTATLADGTASQSVNLEF